MKDQNIFQKGRVRSKLATVGFISWSAIMLSVGVVASNTLSGVGISESRAASSQRADAQIIRLDLQRLVGKSLGEFAPYEPESGDLVARGVESYYSEDSNFSLGVWESRPGKITYTDLEYDELMLVLDGKLVMSDEQGVVEIFAPGEALVLPKGWSGTLAVPEGGVRKLWVAYIGEKKG